MCVVKPAVVGFGRPSVTGPMFAQILPLACEESLALLWEPARETACMLVELLCSNHPATCRAWFVDAIDLLQDLVALSEEEQVWDNHPSVRCFSTSLTNVGEGAWAADAQDSTVITLPILTLARCRRVQSWLTMTIERLLVKMMPFVGEISLGGAWRVASAQVRSPDPLVVRPSLLVLASLAREFGDIPEPLAAPLADSLISALGSGLDPPALACALKATFHLLPPEVVRAAADPLIAIAPHVMESSTDPALREVVLLCVCRVLEASDGALRQFRVLLPLLRDPLLHTPLVACLTVAISRTLPSHKDDFVDSARKRARVGSESPTVSPSAISASPVLVALVEWLNRHQPANFPNLRSNIPRLTAAVAGVATALVSVLPFRSRTSTLVDIEQSANAWALALSSGGAIADSDFVCALDRLVWSLIWAHGEFKDEKVREDQLDGAWQLGLSLWPTASPRLAASVLRLLSLLVVQFNFSNGEMSGEMRRRHAQVKGIVDQALNDPRPLVASTAAEVASLVATELTTLHALTPLLASPSTAVSAIHTAGKLFCVAASTTHEPPLSITPTENPLGSQEGDWEPRVVGSYGDSGWKPVVERQPDGMQGWWWYDDGVRKEAVAEIKCIICDGSQHSLVHAKKVELPLFFPFCRLSLQRNAPLACRLSSLSFASRLLTHIAWGHRNEPIQDHPELWRELVSLVRDDDAAVRTGAGQLCAIMFEYCSFLLPDPMAEPDGHAEWSPSHLALDGNGRVLKYLSAELGRSTDCNTLLATFGGLGLHARGEHFFVVLATLIDHISSDDVSARATAYDWIQRLALERKQTVGEMLGKHRCELSHYVVGKLVDPGGEELVADVAQHLFEIPLPQYLDESLPFVVPHITVSGNRPLLDKVVSLLPKNRDGPSDPTAHRVLTDNVQHVYAHLFLEAYDEDAGGAFVRANEFLYSVTKVMPNLLMRACQTELVNLLMIGVGDEDPEKQGRALHSLSAVCQQLRPDDANQPHAPSVNPKPVSEEELAEFLNRDIVGLVNFISRIVQGEMKLKEGGPTAAAAGSMLSFRAIRALRVVLRLLGPRHAAHVCPKVMSILRSALAQEGLCGAACEAWLTFVLTLGDPRDESLASNLGPVLGDIVVALEPYDTDPFVQQALNHIFKILPPSSPDLQSYIASLVYVPDSWVEAQEAVKEARGGTPITLSQLMTQLATAINIHESSGVRLMALRKLRDVLRRDRSQGAVEDETARQRQESAVDHPDQHIARHAQFNAMVMAERVDPAVGAVIKALLNATRDVTHEVRVLVAECLGEIGAIDPGRIGMSLNLHQSDTVEKADEPFAVDLVTLHLIRGLMADGNAKRHDRAGYAIQELLKALNISGRSLRTDASDKRARRVWGMFQPSVQRLISPFLQTRYTYKSHRSHGMRGPIFSRTNVEFRRWLCDWITRLIDQANCSKAPLFRAVRPPMLSADDTEMASFLLPYLVMSVICTGTDNDRDDIRREILEVLQGAAGGGPSDDVSIVIHPSQFDAGTFESSTDVVMCAQTVLGLIDRLHIWAESSRPGQSKRSAPQRERDERIEALLSGMPQLVMANASFHCRDFTRALLHLESHIRSENQRRASGMAVVGAVAGAQARAAAARAQKTPRDASVDASLASAAACAEVEGETDPLRVHLPFLQRVYAELNEPDALRGVAALRLRTSLEEEIVDHEAAGRWTDAQACYDLAVQTVNEFRHHEGLLLSLRHLGHLETMVGHVDHVLGSRPSENCVLTLHSYLIQAAWRMGNWRLVEDMADQPRRHDFEDSLSSILLHVSRGKDADTAALEAALSSARAEEVANVAASGLNSLQRAYESICHLHMIREIEEAWSSGDISSGLIQEWEARFEITQSEFRAREPILNLRRILLEMMGDQYSVGRTWLQIAELAREAGHHQTAYSAYLRAESLGTSMSFVERARQLWDRGDQHGAMQFLRRGLHPEGGMLDAKEYQKRYAVQPPITWRGLYGGQDSRLLAKAHLTLGKWMQDTGDALGDVVQRYQMVTRLQPRWEGGFFSLARYLDRMLSAQRTTLATRRGGTTQPQMTGRRRSSAFMQSPSLPLVGEVAVKDVIKAYGRALSAGHEFIYQSLPRILTLWFDLGESREPNAEAELTKVHQWLDEKLIVRGMAPYQWFTCLPQLVSRIGHRNGLVWSLLCKILVILLQAYPQQTIWGLVGVLKSTDATRARRADDIISTASQRRPEIRDATDQAARLAQQLVAICDFNVVKPKTERSSKKDKGYMPLLRLRAVAPALSQMCPLRLVVLPTERALTVTMPASTGGFFAPHQPFLPSPTLMSVDDNVEVLGSLAHPRKTIMRGSDGESYTFLCKPDDDLRKDSRMMECFTVINKLLMRDADARRRSLHIRTYSVTPLTERHGLVEWVPHTNGLRPILNGLYAKHGHHPDYTLLRTMYGDTSISPSERLSKCLPMFPPFFYRWLLQHFGEPTAWYQARMALSRSLAVMSMVGYTVGLGDRHGENILFDSTTGDAVHVDFDCIFFKGLRFTHPERVPFRLTHNLVDAMGCTGYEGVFRRTCEVSLHVMRANREILLSVMEAFLHDPLVEWAREREAGEQRTTGDRLDSSQVMALVRARLEGRVPPDENERLLERQYRFETTYVLSVEKHVAQLIEQASDPERLGQMYIGWGSFW